MASALVWRVHATGVLEARCEACGARILTATGEPSSLCSQCAPGAR